MSKANQALQGINSAKLSINLTKKSNDFYKKAVATLHSLRFYFLKRSAERCQ